MKKYLFILLLGLCYISCKKVGLDSEFTIKAKVSKVECNSFMGNICTSNTIYVQTDTQTYTFNAKVKDFNFAIGDVIYLNIRRYIISKD